MSCPRSSNSSLPSLLRKALYVFVLLLTAISVYAQVSTAYVSGEVEDTSGARLPSVAIKLLNLETGNENTAATDAAGEFLLPGLLPGTYSMQVQREGFAAVHVTGLTLNVGESRQFVIKLRLSTVEQTVEVDAGGQSLDTEDAQMSTVVDSNLVQNLPLNGRSFQDLIAMTPGSVSVSPQLPRDSGFSVNGQSPDTNSYWVDGISGNFGSGSLDSDLKVPAAGQYAAVTSLGTTQGLVGLDALQEFRVVASTASAEYGGTTGGQFSLLTRQGTDRIHATAFTYQRYHQADGEDWFTGYYGTPKKPSPYDQKDVGGSLAMPLLFRRQSPAQSRTQFFGSYEENSVRQRTAPLVQYIPSYTLVGSAPTAIQNAFQAFAGYSTTLPGFSTNPALIEFSVYQPSLPSSLRSMDFRIDHTFGTRLSGFLRFGDTPSNSESTSILTMTEAKLSNQSLTLGLDAQLSSQAGNEFRIGWSRAGSSTVSTIYPDLLGSPVPEPGWTTVDLPAALGSPGASSQTRSELYMRIAGIGDTSAWTDGGSNALRQIEVRDTFSFQRGPHLIQVGVDVRDLHSAVRPLPWTIEADYLSGNSVLTNSADYLILRTNEPAHPVFQQFAAFVQDQWRVSRNFNVSAGLRWDVNPPPRSSDGHDAFRVNGNPDLPATMSVSPRGTSLWETDWLTLGPRIGFAWQPVQTPGHELILRGGFGVVYDTPNRAAAPAFTALGFTSTILTRMASIPASEAGPVDPGIPNSESLGYIFPQHLRNPYSLQWNVTVERAVGQHQSIDLSYVGASGHDLLIPQRHQISSSAIPLQELVTFPSGYSSQFDSLQLGYHGQYRSHLAWMTSYVWAHTLDFGSPNPWAAPTRGNADTDVRHNLQAAASWTLPEMGGRGFAHNALSGWGIDARYFLRSSYPVTVLGNLFHDPVTGERFYTGADLVPGRPFYLSNRSVPGGRMLNGGPDVINGAFQLPTGNTQGNAPRNIARGFGAQQLSLSLRRDIHLYDRLYMQLRCDGFNVSNSPDFGYIVPTLTDQLFGQPILSLNQSYGQTGSLYQPGGPRSLQWMVRFRW